MSVAIAEWTALLEKEYLAEFISAGGAAVKIAVAEPENASATISTLADSARRHGYVAAIIDAGQTRVQMIDQLFFAVARSVDWSRLCRIWMQERFVGDGYEIEPAQSLENVEAIAASRGLRAVDVRAEAHRWIANGILKDYRLNKEFRTAMAMLCHAALNPQNVSPTDSEVIQRWLRGERCGAAALKRVQIYGKIGRHNARGMLGSLAVWLKQTGATGLILLLDATIVTMDIAAGEGVTRYTRNAALDFYEVLRQFIDETDEVDSLLLICVAGPGLLDHPKKSLDNYTALKLRTSDEVRDRHRSNPLNALVRLDSP